MITLDLNIKCTTINFSDEEKAKCIADIDECFVNDDWVKDQPPYQTWATLFNRTEQHWQNLKNLIHNEVSKHFDLKDCVVNAWAYVKFGNKEEGPNDSSWHAHNRFGPVCSVVYYLDVPESAEATEFMDSNGNVFRPKLEKNLAVIFDSKTIHRPSIWTSRNTNKNRYVIAVDYKENKMNDFDTKGYVIVKNFIDSESIGTISKYLENFLMRYPENNQGGGQGDSSKISWYADPLIETVLERSTAEVERITGYSLFPSYSFTRVYTKGDELKPHIDRPSCEISVTCHVATVGKPWPIWMQAPGKEPSKHYLEPGDACIYHGCEIKHWRESATETDVNVQFMLHYVRQDGPNAHYKFDKRQKLGLPAGG